MKKEVSIEVDYGPDFNGVLRNKDGVEVIVGDAGLKPYDLLLSALAGCFESTLLDILVKKHVQVDHIHYDIHGTKRETIPSTLDYVSIGVTVTNASDENQFKKSVELAKKYCSIHATIEAVATIDVQVTFK